MPSRKAARAAAAQSPACPPRGSCCLTLSLACPEQCFCHLTLEESGHHQGRAGLENPGLPPQRQQTPEQPQVRRLAGRTRRTWLGATSMLGLMTAKVQSQLSRGRGGEVKWEEAAELQVLGPGGSRAPFLQQAVKWALLAKLG